MNGSAEFGSFALIAEDDIFKTTANSDLVVERHIQLYPDRFFTFQTKRKDPSVKRSYYLDKACELIPKSANSIPSKRKSVREPGSWTITATVKRGARKVCLYEVSVKWPLSWAPKGYTTFTLGVETLAKAQLWHKQLAACLAGMGNSSHDTARGQSSPFLSLSMPVMSTPCDTSTDYKSEPYDALPASTSVGIEHLRAAKDDSLYSAAASDDPSRFQDDDRLDRYSKDVDSEDESKPCCTKVNKKQGTERWIPYKHSNGVAIYRHRPTNGDGGGEYMASSVVRGCPRACLDVLIDPASNTTILGPATDIELVQAKTETNPREVLRIRVEAQGLVGRVCAPRDITVERYVRVDDSGLYVVLFNTVDPVETEQSKKPSANSQSFYTQPVQANVNGGFTIAPLDGYALDESPESLVTVVLKVDMGGYCCQNSYFRPFCNAFGFVEAFVERILMSVILIKDEVEHSRFKVQPFNVISANFDMHADVAGSVDGMSQKLDIARTSRTSAHTRFHAEVAAGKAPTSLLESGDSLLSAAGDQAGTSNPMSQEARMQLGTLLPKYYEILHVEGHDSPFRVRGPSYLKDRIKIPAGEPEFAMSSIDVIVLDNGPVEHLARFLPSIRQNGAAFSFVINLFIPGTPLIALVYTFTSDVPPKQGPPPRHPMDEPHDWNPFDFVLHRFLNGTPEQRNRMLKLIPHIADGSWVIKQSVGTTPVIVGTKLKTSYHQTDRYIEMDIDISANATAAYVTGMVRNTVKSLVIDFGFVLEGTAPWELPESLAGAFRLHRLDLTQAKRIDMSKEIPITPCTSMPPVKRHPSNRSTDSPAMPKHTLSTGTPGTHASQSGTSGSQPGHTRTQSARFSFGHGRHDSKGASFTPF